MSFRAYQKRTRNLYVPGDGRPFRMSRSGIESFLKCARCFYLDRRLGISQPAGLPFSLNAAVDSLLKREFDAYRAKGEPHPLMKASGVEAIPFQHEKLDEWRSAPFAGVTFHHAPSNLRVTGALDDLWVSPAGGLHVVDYKATAKADEVTLDAPWQDSYKRQMEVYQWLLRRNGFTVSDTAYFVYCNGDLTRPALDARLEFRMKILPYEGGDGWVEGALLEIRRCLEAPAPPPAARGCAYCGYLAAVAREVPVCLE